MLDIFVLDHENSRQYTTEFISRIPYAKVYNSSKEQTHFTISFNSCLKKSKADWVMVCNNDIHLSEAVIFGLKQILTTVPPGIYSPVVNSPHWKVMHRNNPEDDQIRLVPWLEFVCPIIHKDVIKKIGYLDELMPRGYGVEMDYCYRAKEAGFLTSLIQAYDIYHYGHGSQLSHEEYRTEASSEMNWRLSTKYGENWQKLLQFPQW